MVKVCELACVVFFFFGGGGGGIFIKMLEESYSIITRYAHPYIRYCSAKETHFYTHELSHFISENVSKPQIQ